MLPISSTPCIRRGMVAAALLLPTAYTVHQQSKPSQNTDVNSISSFESSTLYSKFTKFFFNTASAEVVTSPSQLQKISAQTVRQNNGKVAGRPIYVTYGDKVYDITEFASAHPGGDHILLAAGGPLEPFWNIYKQHDADWVREILDELLVGQLVPDEEWEKQQTKQQNQIITNQDPYFKDPNRHPALIVQSTGPFNAETPSELLVASQNTPNDLFYVRNHMPVPDIDPKEYQLEIVNTDGSNLITLSLQDLKTKFKKHTVAATIQCAGNRRNELSRVRPVRGGKWESGAIGNAEWTGVKLSDVIQYALNQSNQKDNDDKVQHIWFQGLDKDPTSGSTYEASVPIDVMNQGCDIMLAYEMNGEELPKDHGYPIRAVIPGIVGARNVKWLGRVVLSEKESDSHWQRQDYRSFSPDVDWDNVDFSSAPSIQEMPVISAICAHKIDQNKNEMIVDGYAWSGGGRGIIRVDVSVDGGKSWKGAELKAKENKKRNEIYDWTLWSVRIPLNTIGSDKIELVCKAIDSSYNTQPDSREAIWNLRGLLNNSWHRVKV